MHSESRFRKQCWPAPTKSLNDVERQENVCFAAGNPSAGNSAMGRLPRSAGRVVEPASRHRAAHRSVAPGPSRWFSAPARTRHPSLSAPDRLAARRQQSAVWRLQPILPRPLTLSRSHRDALPRVCNEPPGASNIQCFRDGRPRRGWGGSGPEILDTTTLKAQHSCRFAGRSSGRLLIRRSLVRAQVGEPRNSRGYVGEA